MQALNESIKMWLWPRTEVTVCAIGYDRAQCRATPEWCLAECIITDGLCLPMSHDSRKVRREYWQLLLLQLGYVDAGKINRWWRRIFQDEVVVDTVELTVMRAKQRSVVCNWLDFLHLTAHEIKERSD